MTHPSIGVSEDSFAPPATDAQSSAGGVPTGSSAAAPGGAGGVVTIPEGTVTGDPAGAGGGEPATRLGGGTVTLPEVTVVGDPALAGGGEPQSAADPAPGTTTIPEVTVTGTPDNAGAASGQVADPSLGVAAGGVGMAVFGGLAPGLPGSGPTPPALDPGVLDLPKIPEPFPQGPAGSGLGGAAEGGTVLGDGAALVPEAAAVGGEGAAVAAGGETVLVAGAPALEVGLGAAALEVGLVAAPVVGLIGAAIMGPELARKAWDWVSEPASPTEEPGDPDNPNNSTHGVGGAPPQTMADGSNPVDGGTDEPQQAPGADGGAPIVDPGGENPVAAPGAPGGAPVTDPSPIPPGEEPSLAGDDDTPGRPRREKKKKDTRRPPADELGTGEAKNADGSVNDKAGSHGTFRGGESKREQDEVFDRVVREIPLNKDEARKLHDAIGGKNLDRTGILEHALPEFPKKADRIKDLLGER